jgi:hypothetical protein
MLGLQGRQDQGMVQGPGLPTVLGLQGGQGGGGMQG